MALWVSPDKLAPPQLNALFRHAFLCRSPPTISIAEKKAGARGAGLNETTFAYCRVALTPNVIAPLPDWCAPMSGAASWSLKFGMRVPAP